MKIVTEKFFVVGAGVFATLVFTLLLYREDFLLNYSPSISPGIYIRSTNQTTGQFAHFAIPPDVLKFLKTNKSVIPSRGFLKPTLAYPPFHQCYDPKTRIFTIAGYRLPASKLPPLFEVRSGCYQQVTGVFVYSSRVPNSLDSRHYGSIPLSEIDFFHPLWVIENE